MTVTSSARRTRAPILCDASPAIPPFAVLRKTIPHSILTPHVRCGERGCDCLAPHGGSAAGVLIHCQPGFPVVCCS